jgi:RNA polymerase sigma-70 factor (ECF subfamily)
VAVAVSGAAADGAEVRAAQDGDRAAFARLLTRHGPAAHAVLLSMLGPDRAEDRMQEVCLLAWRELPQLREPSRFVPWLLTLARNHGRRALRERRRAPRSLEDEQVPAVTDPAHWAAAEILAEVAALPRAYREVVTLRLVAGLDAPALAAATGRSPGAVRVQLHRALGLLRERLQRAGYRPGG